MNEYSPYDVALGKIIKAKRKEKRITMQQLGIYLGVSKPTIYGYEIGRRSMNASTFFKICDILSLDPNLVANQVRAEVYEQI